MAAPDSPVRFGEASLVSLLGCLGPIDEHAVDALLAHIEVANDGPMDDDAALVVVTRRA